jgi:hypothetical protein
MKPRYQHDCEACTYLGRYADAAGHISDLYFCIQGLGAGLPTVVARHGDRGHEYTSGLAAADYVASLGAARDRAVERGLLKS